MDNECTLCGLGLNQATLANNQAPCGHPFCPKCIAVLSECPLDGQSLQRARLNQSQGSIRQLDSSINSLSRRWSLTPTSSSSRCGPHGNKCSYFCLAEMAAICPDCMFHCLQTRHDVQQIEVLQNEMLQIKRDCQEMEAMCRPQNYVGTERDKERFRQQLGVGQEKITAAVNDLFAKVTAGIDQAKRRVLDQINQIFVNTSKIIELYLANSQNGLDADADFLSKFKDNIDYFKGMDDDAKVDQTSVKRLFENQGFIMRAQELQSLTKSKKPLIDIEAVPQTIAENILKAFQGNLVFDKSIIAALISKLDLFNDVDPAYAAAKSPVIILENAPVDEEAHILGLVKAFCAYEKLGLQVGPPRPSTQCIAFKMASDKAAAHFQLLNSTPTKGEAKLSIRRIDQELRPKASLLKGMDSFEALSAFISERVQYYKHSLQRDLDALVAARESCEHLPVDRWNQLYRAMSFLSNTLDAIF